MRKLVFTLLAVLMLFSGCAAQEKAAPQFVNTHCRQEYLTNGVLSQTDDYIYHFNSQGLVTCLEIYQDDTLFSLSTWEYDEFGNIIQRTEERDGIVKIYDYNNILDEAGRILQQEVWLGNVRITLRDLTYNRQGKETSHHATFWYEDGELDGGRNDTMTYNWKGELSKQVLLWDRGDQYVQEYQDGLCIRATSYAAETGQVTEYSEYAYDQKGRCIRESNYDGEGNLKLYHESVYDDTARTKTRTRYQADGTADSYSDVYTYDEFGNQILQERFEDGEVYWRIRNTYELLETVVETN